MLDLDQTLCCLFLLMLLLLHKAGPQSARQWRSSQLARVQTLLAKSHGRCLLLQDFNIMLLKTLFTSGTYVHWRNFMALWQVLNGKKEQQGLKLQQLPPDTFGVPGCRNSYWISLDPSRLKDAPPAKAACVLMFLHGEHMEQAAPTSVAGSISTRTWVHTQSDLHPILPVPHMMCVHVE
jgi:hypothetical protein